MTIGPVSIETQSELSLPAEGGRSLFVACGYAIINFTSLAPETDIHRDTLEIVVGPRWAQLHAVVPIVTPVAFAYDGASPVPANGTTASGDFVTVAVPGPAIPLWAVDNCSWSSVDSRIGLQSTIALRGGTNRAWMMRVAYQVIAAGVLA